MEKEIKLIDIDRIEQSENARLTFRSEEMAELMTSMKFRGLLSPIGVRKKPGNGHYEVVFGNRRLVAAQKLDWKKIECLVLDSVDTNEEMLVVNAVENLQRADIPYSEQGRIFYGLKKSGLSTDEIAAKIGIKGKKVHQMLAMYERLPADMRTKVSFGKPGLRMKGGKIPATSASLAIDLTSRLGLKAKEAREVLKFAGKDGNTGIHVRKIGHMMKEGISFKNASKLIEKTRCITISVLIDEKHIEKLEKEHEMRIHEIVYETLKAEEWLGVITQKGYGKTGR